MCPWLVYPSVASPHCVGVCVCLPASMSFQVWMCVWLCHYIRLCVCLGCIQPLPSSFLHADWALDTACLPHDNHCGILSFSVLVFVCVHAHTSSRVLCVTCLCIPLPELIPLYWSHGLLPHIVLPWRSSFNVLFKTHNENVIPPNGELQLRSKSSLIFHQRSNDCYTSSAHHFALTRLIQISKSVGRKRFSGLALAQKLQ